MFKIFTDALLIFLVTYALIDILYRLLSILSHPDKCLREKTKILLYCETDDAIEKLVRQTAGIMHSSRLPMLIVLKKETRESELIIKQLCHEFPHIKIISLSDDVASQIFEDAFLNNA